MSVLVVLVGGAEDGREFRVPDDDPIATSGVLALPDTAAPPAAGLVGETFTLLRYRWDGTVRGDGARRFRPAGS
ncbi:hypothetical protein [Pseudonocardia adelaidensis]|uniref:Uncharacterized protein n=1 Tax=Pseudonocardia adelaidensis TaxID=648754 RepID=A0ABP9NNM1_9PSEU